MAKGFDPKWSLVALLCSNRGVDGSSVIIPEKGATDMNVTGGVALSTACPAFVKGAAYFGNPTASQSLYPQNQSFGYQDQAYEIEFFPTGFGETGDRYLFSVSTILRVYFDIDDELLRVDFKNNGVEQNFSAPVDLNSLVGVVSKCIVRLTTGRLDVELNGTTLIDVAHGLTSFDVATGPILSIGNRAATGTNLTNFYGYIGQFRRTVGDSRQEESSAVIYDLEVLSALDPYREKVVFHSHCEPTGGPIEDVCGNEVEFYGGAAITPSKNAFGTTSLYLGAGGAVVYTDFVLGTQDFEFEAFATMLFDLPNRAWCIGLLDGAGEVALGIATKRDSTSETSVIVNGVSHTVALGLNGAMQHLSLVRSNGTMTLFINGASVLTFDVTGVSISNVGPLYIGKPPSISEVVADTLYMDEIRLTVGQARSDASAASTTVPTERFNEYGPHSMRGTVKRMVSGSAVISPGSLVAAFDRKTLRLVSRDVSAADGSFELPSAHGDEHFVLAFDDEMNLVGYDKILPAIFS